MKRGKIMKKKLLLVVMSVLLVSASIFAGCGQSNSQITSKTKNTTELGTGKTTEQTAQKTDVIRLAVMTGNITQAAAVIGQNTGIYKKYGLEVQTTEFAAGINTVDALTLNQSDIGMIADYAWVNRLGSTADSTTLKVFTRLATSNGTATNLYINKKLASSVQDLSGKTIATVTGTVWDYYNSLLIEKYNLKDVKILNTSSQAEMEALYQSGKAAAFFGSGQTAKMVEALDFTQKELSLKDLGVSTDMFYVADKSYLEKNADVVKRFLQANKEIYDYIASDSATAANLVNEKLAIPKETFLGGLKDTDLLIDLKQQSIDSLNTINSWAKKKGRYNLDYNAKDFIYLDVIKGLYPDKVDITQK